MLKACFFGQKSDFRVNKQSEITNKYSINIQHIFLQIGFHFTDPQSKISIELSDYCGTFRDIAFGL